jgi:hypothetical protein
MHSNILLPGLETMISQRRRKVEPVQYKVLEHTK